MSPQHYSHSENIFQQKKEELSFEWGSFKRAYLNCSDRKAMTGTFCLRTWCSPSLPTVRPLSLDSLKAYLVKDVAKISTNKMSTFDFSISTFISQHVSTLNRVLLRGFYILNWHIYSYCLRMRMFL